jgi:hypothetical protein
MMMAEQYQSSDKSAAAAGTHSQFQVEWNGHKSWYEAALDDFLCYIPGVVACICVVPSVVEG